MFFKFAKINHISDVLPFIEGKSEFVIVNKGDYIVINYVISGNETFPPMYNESGDFSEASSILREMRGIIFDSKSGKLIRRPLIKFFNIGEREEYMLKNLDFSQSHVVMEKLDGSMIAPFIVNDKLFWGTKMGYTDVAEQAVQFIKDKPWYELFANAYLSHGITPIFEWCSNKQRIVIDHKEDKLVLLGMRYMNSGNYVSRPIVEYLAETFSIPVVAVHPSVTGDALEYMKVIQNEWNDKEGIVIQFASGDMVKVKSEWYVNLHRVKDSISSERKIVRLIIDNALDDLKPLMDKSDFERVEEYQSKFLHEVESVAVDLFDGARIYRYGLSRKQFALEVYPNMNPLCGAIAFRIWDYLDKGKEVNRTIALEMVLDKISGVCSNNKNFDDVKKAFFENIKYMENELDDN